MNNPDTPFAGSPFDACAEMELIGANDPETHERMCLLRVAGEVLRQAVDDVACGIFTGLLDEDFSIVRKLTTRRNHGTGAVASEPEILDAVEFLRDWRSAHLCDVVSTCAPRAPISPAFLRSRVRPQVQVFRAMARVKGTCSRGARKKDNRKMVQAEGRS